MGFSGAKTWVLACVCGREVVHFACEACGTRDWTSRVDDFVWLEDPQSGELVNLAGEYE